MIQATQLTKRYGSKTAVDELSFTVEPGAVTGFLGPNGAGKSTTMRMILDLDKPSSGFVQINGKTYSHQQSPLREVGALLEARAIHPARSARNHLLFLAQSNGISRKRVDEVLEIVGLFAVRNKRVGKFSLGMGQRLGIAVALLGNPQTIILDEPVNGLDPDGVLWIRNLLRDLAREGRTIFISSHLMSEMALIAEHLVIVGKGRLLADTTVSSLIASAQNRPVRVISPQSEEIFRLLSTEERAKVRKEENALLITGLLAADIGRLARYYSWELHELSTQEASLEEVYMNLTRNSREYLTDNESRQEAAS